MKNIDDINQVRWAQESVNAKRLHGTKPNTSIEIKTDTGILYYKCSTFKLPQRSNEKMV